MIARRLSSSLTFAILIAFLAATAGVSRANGPSNRASATATSAAPAPGPSGYHLLKKIKLGGEGFWDYLSFDSPTRRLFISRGTKVVVLDVDSEKVVGEIPDTPGVHGIALVPDRANGFTSNGQRWHGLHLRSQDASSGRPRPGGTNPDAIIYDPASKRVFAMNGRSGDVTAIDVASGSVAGTIAVGGKLEFAVSDGAGHIYVNVEDKSEEVQIDSQEPRRHRPLAARALQGAVRSGDRCKASPSLRRLRQQDDGRGGRRFRQESSPRPRSATALTRTLSIPPPASRSPPTARAARSPSCTRTRPINSPS